MTDENFEPEFEPNVTLYGTGGPYSEDYDLADPYRFVVSSSTGARQSCDAGGSHFRLHHARSEPHEDQDSEGSLYYYKRAGTGHELPNCGHAVRVSACLDQFCRSPVVPIINRCHRYECPECYHETVKRASKTAAKALYNFSRDLASNYGMKAGKPKHVVLSPNPKNWPKGRVLEDGASSLDRMAKKVLTWAAKDGFLAMKGWRHFEREKHKDGSECPGKSCELPTSEHKWVWGPHYHFVGFGFFKNNAEVQAKFPGWSLSVIGEAVGKDRDIYATLLYQGSHASVLYYDRKMKKNEEGELVEDERARGRQARKMILSVGMMSPSIYCRKLDHEEYEVKKCLCCGKDRHIFRPGELPKTADHHQDLGAHTVRRKIYRYEFNEAYMTKWLRDGVNRLRRRAREIRNRFHNDYKGYQKGYPVGERNVGPPDLQVS